MDSTPPSETSPDGSLDTASDRPPEAVSATRYLPARPIARSRARQTSIEQVTPTLERVTVRGSGGNTTVIRKRAAISEFRGQEPGFIKATNATLTPETPLGRAGQRVQRFFLGAPIATEHQENERLTKIKALAVLSSDAISSVAYGTEASLGILIVAGVGLMQYNLWIAASIALLMVIVGTSYFQTIHAYPHGGGSYIVARDNLGDWPGLIAAAALLIDYVLTVSVSVAAGVDALVSAYSTLAPFAVVMGVVFIAIIMIVNLRGVRESGTIFAAPTYLFVGAFLLMIVVGIIHAAFSHGGLLTPDAPQKTLAQLGWTAQKFGPLLILTAFASGCSAMTGVEAISNGVPAFKKPESHNAARTLVAMISILVTLYLGVTFLAWRFGIQPYAGQQPTVDAQIAGLLFNGPFSWVFYIIQFATTLILVLAANTSFADFPRLASILARDGFMPRQFSFRGNRLAFSTGIIVLSLLSTILLVIFHGNTDALINLYALGVFTAFTLSQSGMVVRWWRHGHSASAEPHWQRSLVINLVGAFSTGIVTLVIMVSKFDRGAWIVVLLVPILVLLFRGISRHYKQVTVEISQLAVPDARELKHLAIVPISRFDHVAQRSIAYAQSLGVDVVVAHVIADQDDDSAIRDEWNAWLQTQRMADEADANGATNGATNSGMNGSANGSANGSIALRRPSPSGRYISPALLTAPQRGGIKEPQLALIRSPYRALVAPLVRYVSATQREIRKQHPETVITVVLPEYITEHWWERLLHNEAAFRLKLALYNQPGVAVTNVPYHLGQERRDRAKAAKSERAGQAAFAEHARNGVGTSSR